VEGVRSHLRIKSTVREAREKLTGDTKSRRRKGKREGRRIERKSKR